MAGRTVRTLGEFGLIEQARRRLTRLSPGGGWRVRLGIGDDAAVLQGRRGEPVLLACDMVVEGVHFTARTPARAVGWKAVAVNASDIAAMGGVPVAAVVSLGLPPTTPVQWVRGFTDGLARCARSCHMALVGGDTVRAPQRVADVAILGAVGPRGPIARRGARLGDRLFVTGRLGGSMRSGRHAAFTPRWREAQRLLRRLRVHAMMDLSDGLAQDLWNMSRASRVTLRVRAALVPVAPEALGVSGALHDGEDYELLFALGPADARRVPRRLGECPVTEIGAAVRRGVGVELEYPDGSVSPLSARGFAHFGEALA